MMVNAVQDLRASRASSASGRRATQRETLIACAEKVISEQGLAALRARQLAECVGCAVGAIYNLVTDLDELVLIVGQRTMAGLNARLDAVVVSSPTKGRRETTDTTAAFVAWALAYLAFAAENRNLWRALFEFRLPPGRPLPDWFAADQMRLFVRLEDALGVMRPDLDATARRLCARTLFSAVHGIVALGLEEKLVALPPAPLQEQLAAFVRVYLAGLRSA